jgi:hypothetical protein
MAKLSPPGVFATFSAGYYVTFTNLPPLGRLQADSLPLIIVGVKNTA